MSGVRVPLSAFSLLWYIRQLNGHSHLWAFGRIIKQNLKHEKYQYANYEIADVEQDYSRYNAKITAMQLALDRFNQTYEFNVDVENEIKLSPKL